MYKEKRAVSVLEEKIRWKEADIDLELHVKKQAELSVNLNSTAVNNIPENSDSSGSSEETEIPPEVTCTNNLLIIVHTALNLLKGFWVHGHWGK